MDGDEMEVIEGNINRRNGLTLKRRTVAIMLGRDSGEMFQVVYPGEQTMGCKFVRCGVLGKMLLDGYLEGSKGTRLGWREPWELQHNCK